MNDPSGINWDAVPDPSGINWDAVPDKPKPAPQSTWQQLKGMIPKLPYGEGLETVAGLASGAVAPAVAGIAGAKAAATQDAQNLSDLEFKPQIATDVATADILGKERGETYAQLVDLTTTMPELQKTVDRLSDLGKEATYTQAGQLYDTLVKESGGAATPGSVAAVEYIKTVDNVVLPLLKQTFGAAFTVQEGQSLRDTLGNPNYTPEQKDAALRAFITQKYANIEAAKAKANAYAPMGGMSGPPMMPPTIEGSTIPLAPKNGATRKKFNPATGRVE